MKTMMRYVLIFAVSLVMLTGCGNSSSSGGDNNGSAPVVEQNSSIGDDTNNTTPPIDKDTTSPVIRLNGELNITLTQGEKYIELGAIATDNVDGNLTADINISGEVDTSKVGKYLVIYSVSDSSGNEANVSRGVEVKVKEESTTPTSSSTPTSTTPSSSNTAKAKVSLEDIELPSENKYYVATSKSTTEFDANSDVAITTEKDEKELVALTDEFGNSFLIARKIEGQSEVDISLDSTAEVFVLMRTRFFGRTIKNEKLLSERIKKSENFNKLKQELARRIKISPCPLNSECSPVAAYIADKVANSLDLTDVIDEEK